MLERLCVIIGIIMEDTSALALLATSPEATRHRIVVLEQAGRDIVVLSEAAAVIVRRCRDRLGSVRVTPAQTTVPDPLLAAVSLATIRDIAWKNTLCRASAARAAQLCELHLTFCGMPP